MNAASEMPNEADVLLVDDDPLVLRVVARVLVAAGYTVEKTEDSQSAVPAALSGAYSVVVSDIQMPGLSGVEMLHMLRDQGCDVPVVLMTGSPSAETARTAVELGVTHYLIKPVSSAALLDVVARALAAAGKERGRKSSEAPQRKHA